jgi:hypothetical protein
MPGWYLECFICLFSISLVLFKDIESIKRHFPTNGSLFSVKMILGMGRVLCTELTKQGRKIVAEAHDIIHKVESRMLATISEDHKMLLEKLLLECFNNLSNGGMG